MAESQGHALPMGKDTSVMPHFVTMAFYPSRPPFPHSTSNDTEVREIYEFRDKLAVELVLIVYQTPNASSWASARST